MGVPGGGAPVSGPSRVTQPGRPFRHSGAHAFYKRGKLPGAPLHHSLASAVYHGDTRAIISPVLQATEGVEEYGRGRSRSDISYDATHVFKPVG